MKDGGHHCDVIHWFWSLYCEKGCNYWFLVIRHSINYSINSLNHLIRNTFVLITLNNLVQVLLRNVLLRDCWIQFLFKSCCTSSDNCVYMSVRVFLVCPRCACVKVPCLYVWVSLPLNYHCKTQMRWWDSAGCCLQAHLVNPSQTHSKGGRSSSRWFWVT